MKRVNFRGQFPKIYEIRMGAVSIIGFQACSKKTSEQTKKEHFFMLWSFKNDTLIFSKVLPKSGNEKLK